MQIPKDVGPIVSSFGNLCLFINFYFPYLKSRRQHISGIFPSFLRSCFGMNVSWVADFNRKEIKRRNLDTFYLRRTSFQFRGQISSCLQSSFCIANGNFQLFQAQKMNPLKLLILLFNFAAKTHVFFRFFIRCNDKKN